MEVQPLHPARSISCRSQSIQKPAAHLFSLGNKYPGPWAALVRSTSTNVYLVGFPGLVATRFAVGAVVPALAARLRFCSARDESGAGRTLVKYVVLRLSSCPR